MPGNEVSVIHSVDNHDDDLDENINFVILMMMMMMIVAGGAPLSEGLLLPPLPLLRPPWLRRLTWSHEGAQGTKWSERYSQ